MKLYYFIHLIRTYDEVSCIVFIKSCVQCMHMHHILEKLEIGNTSLHSMLSQRERLNNLHMFKRRKHKILLATDLAARGLDIPAVDLVVNYDIPRTAVAYIHRVGRTARNNKRGLAISLITQYDVRLIQNIEEKIGEKLEALEGINEKAVLESAKEINSVKRAVAFVRKLFCLFVGAIER